MPGGAAQVPSKITAAKRPRRPRGDAAGGKDRRFVTALARGLMILRAFENSSDQLGNVEIARRTGLPRPTVSRLTYTLTRLGYLSSVGERYQLGISLMALGLAFFSANSFPQAAQPYLQELADQIQCNVALFVRERLECLLLKVFTGETQNIAVRLNVGARVPIGGSITGMTMLAALPPEDREGILAELRTRRIGDWRTLRSEIERCQNELRGQRYAVGLGIWHKDINTVAAPVVAQGTEELVVISVSGPSFSKTEQVLHDEIGPALVATVDRLRNLQLAKWPAALRTYGTTPA